MKKLLLTAFAVASLAMTFTSCKKDVSEEELLKNQLAQADSLLKRGGVIKYTIKVVSTANSSMLKAKMSIENASVTVYQNDKVFTGQTDAMGFVTFPDMRVGTVAVNVTLKDHAEVDYIADITPQEQLTNLSQSQVVNTIRYASTMVPMFPIADPGCATITGKVTAELDLTNITPEPAPGVKVTAMVDVDDPDFVSRYIAPTLSSSTPSAGRILKYSFAPDAEILTTKTDANGYYELKVPASINGLPIKISVEDYQTTQKLYLENDPTTGKFAPAEYTVNAIYTKRIPSSETPVVKPIYATIEKPTGIIGEAIKSASFNVTVDANGGITSVDVLTRGNYDRKPDLVIIGNGTGAEIEPIYNPTTGEVEKVIVNKAGKGYINKSTWTLATLQKELRNAIVETIIKNNNGIYSLTINTKEQGQGYITNPQINFITLGDNVQPICTISVNLWIQKITGVNLKTGGVINTDNMNHDKTINNNFNNSILTNNSNNYYLYFHLGKGTRI